ncbi:hypothetical protein [Propionivibrio sp.]
MNTVVLRPYALSVNVHAAFKAYSLQITYRRALQGDSFANSWNSVASDAL